MTEDTFHYLLGGEGNADDFNQQMYKLGQQPRSWIQKGLKLKRDAEIFYESCEISRQYIVSELKKIDFNSAKFYRWELQKNIEEILSKNLDHFLPDYDTYYLLMHLSIENLLKGIWLDSNPENIGFNSLPKPLKTHNLIILAKDIGLILSKEQKEVLKKLKELFLGYSRYPIKQNVKPASHQQDLVFGDRNFDTICIDCLENPYAKDKQVIEKLFKEGLDEKIDLVFQHSHERMLSTFDFEKQQDSDKEPNNKTK